MLVDTGYSPRWKESWAMPDSVAFRRAVRDRRIRVHALPSDLDLTTRPAVAEFLAGPWLWTQLVFARQVLLFRSDTILCANAKQ